MSNPNEPPIAKKEQKVVFFGHGFMYHFISKELKKKGWIRINNKGNKNLGLTKMIKDEED